MAREFGLLPHEYLERVSQRWHEVLIAWLDSEWDRPDRSDQYLMQIAREVRQVLSKRTWKLDDFRLKFGRKEEPEKMPAGIEAAYAKAKWLGFMKSTGAKHELKDGE